MYLDHIAIYTRELERLKDFYIKYFSGRANNKYHNTKTGLQTYFITFEGGARLELMQRPDLAVRDKTIPSDGPAHLAFRMGSREKVDELTQILVSDGYAQKSAPRDTGDGYYESCILDPDFNEVEIVA
ncbi:MAG: VOC family protein [Eubacteriales bacterium]|nr:VOC family protein [Eubacteriales bacterium]